MKATEVATGSAYAVDSAVATASPKVPGDNQDRVRSVLAVDGAACVVCDGVGSYPDSGIVAERSVSIAAGHLTTMGALEGVLSCADVAASALAEEDLPTGATTLLAVGADTDGGCAFTLVGNGSILVLEPLSVRDGRADLLVAELAIPHCAIVGSQAALRSFLPAPALPVEQASGSLSALRRRPRLLLACTDGVATPEEREIGRVPSTGALWKRVPTALAEITTSLERAWGAFTTAKDPGDELAIALRDGLKRALAAGALDDDATVAAIYVRPVSTEGVADRHRGTT